MIGKRLIALCASVGVLAGIAGCGSSGGGASGATGNANSGGTVKIGLISDMTGPASSAYADSKVGVDAYINYVNAHGGVGGKKIDVVVADTTSSPTGAQSAAQKLVQQDNVFAIIENSLFFFGAESYLAREGIPVVGSGVDSTVWADPKNKNLFAAEGIFNMDYMQLASGQYMKDRGATSCAAIATSDSPSATKAATAFTKSCEAAGLKSGYLNSQIPEGSTDVGPIALAIKNSGSDGLYTAVVPSTAFALVARLHELGVHMKSILVPSGYGSDLLASPAGVRAAQGVDFSTFGYPAEVHTPGTDLRRANLAKVGAKSPPTAGQQFGYLIAVAFVAGLRAAGKNPSRETFITKMRAIKDFTGGGLLPNKVNFSQYKPTTSCLTIVKLVGTKFVPMKPMPLCAGTKKIF